MSGQKFSHVWLKGLYIYSGEDLPEDIKEYRCVDCGKPFDNYNDKNGKTWNAGQMYHMAEKENQQRRKSKV